MRNYVSTDLVDKCHKTDYWQEMICNAYAELECENIRSDGGFYGAVEIQSFGKGKISNVVSDKQHVKRTLRQIKKSDNDHFLLSLQTAGKSIVRQNSRDAFINIGDMVLYDTAYEYDLVFSGRFEQIILEIPRDMATDFLHIPEKLNAIRLAGNKPSILIIQQLIKSIYHQIPEMEASQQEIFFKTILQLVESQYNHNDIPNIDYSCAKYLQLNNVKNYITENLQDYSLNVAKVALAHQISSRYLSMMFKNEVLNVAAWIKNQRMIKVASDLQNPLLNCLTITEIVFKWGFNDLSSFTKSFKKKYKMTAGHYRSLQRNINQ